MSGRARGWIDGASRGNPGESGFGVLLETEGGEETILGFLGRTTNNVAEYAALLAALTRARQLGLEHLTLFSDSQLLVRQMGGRYRVKAPHLIPIFLQALTLRRQIPHFSLRHVPRGENSRADGLANQAIDERSPVPKWLELPS